MQTLKDEEKKSTRYKDLDNVDVPVEQKNNFFDKVKILRILEQFKNKSNKTKNKSKKKFLKTKENEDKSKIKDVIKNNKKSEIIKKDMKGKPVFLEDTGEKLGIVYDSIYDENNKLKGYRIKDSSSDAVLSFPLNQFEKDKKGLIFIPSWYINALRTVEKLEFKDRVSPELTALLTDDEDYNKELYQLFIKHDSEMADFIDETLTLKEMLNSHLKVLEGKREDIKEDLMDLTERRLIKNIDRRKFAEDVAEHRKKVNILEANIQKCKNLLKRLDETSFGILGKNLVLSDENNLKIFKHNILDDKNEINNEYKEKYLNLKEKFENLENQYDELKNSVEKLIK